jgi:altronate hydrolase
VAVALKPLEPGDAVFSVVVREKILPGHKVALQNLAAGQAVMKYGHPIGRASVAIEAGQWVHSHNLATRLSGKLDYAYAPEFGAVERGSDALPDTFMGYVRDNGGVGIRNEIWIINTVGCVNKTAERLSQMANASLGGPGIDGFYAFSHPYGCSQLGDDLSMTQTILARMVQHPNAAAVLVLGLGCESNQISDFRQVIGTMPDRRVRYLTVQAVSDEWTEGMAILEELADYARSFKRVPVPVSHLTLGLKCGGSDGFSGITANPLVGLVSDRLVARDGTSLLTEVPEMFGAETILMNRAQDSTTFASVVDLINGFKDYFVSHGEVIYENPSPGNKEGGITTLEEKSLGCIQKGGQSPVNGVMRYGQTAAAPGLHLVQSPGNDAVSVTALAASGAHLVLFTTGRGTPFGGPVPTLKISTNSELARKKPGWIDFDAGQLLDGADPQALADELYRLVIANASGDHPAHNETHGFREIAIFKDGVTL